VEDKEFDIPCSYHSFYKFVAPNILGGKTGNVPACLSHVALKPAEGMLSVFIDNVHSQKPLH